MPARFMLTHLLYGTKTRRKGERSSKDQDTRVADELSPIGIVNGTKITHGIDKETKKRFDMTYFNLACHLTFRLMREGPDSKLILYM